MTELDLPQEDARKLMLSGVALAVIDVRTPAEFAAGHIPNAVNIELDAIVSGNIPEALADKSAKYLLYCRSGRRSGIAARYLHDHGWEDVVNFGGILDCPHEIER